MVRTELPTLLLFLVPAWGHSYLALPASRNLLANLAGREDCPHCLQSGGPDNVKERGSATWPSRLAPTSHGLCGDPVQGKSTPTSWQDETYLKSGPITATYRAGEIVEFQVAVSTHHLGHYEFRICDRVLNTSTVSSPAEGQQCLDQWLLQRAPPLENCQVNDARGDCQPLDPKHPERWYLPPAGSQTPVAGPNFDDSMAPSYPSSAEVHIMRYKLPEGLSCSACTLQWYWSSGNSCVYDGDYFDYYRGIASMGWDASAWQPQILASWATCENSCCNRDKFGEEFWNCADIAILPGGSTVSTSTMSTTSTAETSSTTATTTIITDDEFRPVDGGVGRACRGAHAGDNLATYFTVLNGISSLEECKEKCLQSSAPPCVGIEYSRGRCEVWTRPAGIGTSIPLTGFTCLRYGAEPTTTTSPAVPGSFEPVDGGENRVCRGANPNDNKPEYYTVLQGIGTLQLCKAQCASTEGCVGIEFKGSRCEVWTRPQGIEASRSLSGFWCLRYSAPSTTTSREGLTCSQAWGACGGRNWDGPNCCEEGYSCIPESEWYSQCRPAENTAALMEMPGLKPRTWKRFRGTTMLQDGSLLSRTKGTSKDEL
ncbi:unnamed protein product [Cladocopium goreaui]|uniref:Exoglucanase 2 n=1 Tax=Cladocopium goreaui TaxID=2562237 RepID=A0A9P1DNY3_9DINO|nr:unnamed protein product [Cladocopium goreaui]